MILAVDVHYTDTCGFAAGVAFDEWNSPEPAAEFTVKVASGDDHISGAFYKRELPCILKTHPGKFTDARYHNN